MLNNSKIFWDQIITLTIRELKLKYKNTFLGFFWSLLMPLSQTLIFFLIFGVYIRFKMENYVLYLMTGLFVWQSFSNMICGGMWAFLGNGNLIKKLSCRREVFVWPIIFSELFHFALTIPITLIVLGVAKIPVEWHFLWFLPLMLLLGLFCAGLIMVVGTCQMFLRDMERIIGIILQLWFYVTPIFYPENIVPERYVFTLKLNPIYCFVKGWRGIFMPEPFPVEVLAECAVWSAIFLLIGWGCLRLGYKKFAEVI